MSSRYSQKPENTATNRQTRTDPAEIGNNADAVFPGDGAGVGDNSLVIGPFKPGAAAAAADVGEDWGERLPVPAGAAAAAAGVSDNPQLEAEGADSLQAAGRDIALVTFKTTPN